MRREGAGEEHKHCLLTVPNVMLSHEWVGHSCSHVWGSCQCVSVYVTVFSLNEESPLNAGHCADAF